MRKVLFIDNDREFLRLARQFLGKAPYEVETAGNYGEALARCDHFKPDFVFLNIHLPFQSAFAICSALRRDPEMEKVAFIFLSGTVVQKAHFKMAAEAGAKGVIPRFTSGDDSQFFAMLEKVMEGDQSSFLQAHPSSTDFIVELKTTSSMERFARGLETYVHWYNRIFSDMGIGITLIDAHRQICFANQEALRILNVSPASYLGKDFLEFHSELTRENAQQYFSILTSSDYVEPLNLKVPYKGKTLQLTISRLVEPGSFEGLIVTISDYTFGNETVTLKSNLISSLGHTLLNQIDAFQTGLDIAKEILSTEGAEQASLFLNRLYDSLHEMENTTLDVARISQELGTTARVAQDLLDVSDILHQVSQELLPMATRKHVEVELLVASDLPTVSGDPGLIRKVIFNLLRNAIRFSDDSQKVEANLIPAESYLRLEIIHRGKGLDVQQIDHIFRNRFHVAQVHYGKILNLSLIKEIVEAHGGTLQVESTPGSVTRFILHLPFEEDRFIGTAEDSQDTVEVRISPCIIAEDDVAVRRILQGRASQSNYPLMFVSTDEELKSALDAHPEAFCFLNLLSSGIDLPKVLKKLDSQIKGRVWLNSLVPVPDGRKSPLVSGFDDFLIPGKGDDWTKPLHTYLTRKGAGEDGRGILVLAREKGNAYLDKLKKDVEELGGRWDHKPDLREAVLAIFQAPPEAVIFDYALAKESRFEIVHLLKSSLVTRNIPLYVVIPGFAPLSDGPYYYLTKNRGGEALAALEGFFREASEALERASKI